MIKSITIGLVLLGMNALAQEKPKPKESNVSVAISFSVEEYDPSTPTKAVMKCLVRNDTDEAVQVPVGYDGKMVRLESAWDKKGTQPSFLGYANEDPYAKKEKNDVRLVRLEPGKEQVVFEFPLDDLLVRGTVKDGSLVWVWPDWILHPGPPRSPIFRRSSPWNGQFDSREFVAEATFAVRLKLGGQTVNSSDAHLKVKSKTKEAKVAVALSLSVDEYDPSTPTTAVIKCVLRNDGDQAVQVPASYDGKRIRLESTSRLVLNRMKVDDLDRLERKTAVLKGKLAASDDPDMIVALAHELADTIKSRNELQSQRLIRLESGKEHVVFELSLDDLLLRGRTTDGAFKWSWSLRPAPPRSPIYGQAGSQDLVAEASFVVRLTIGDQTVDSKFVRLKVKRNE
jgi:hypothetical protein